MNDDVMEDLDVIQEEIEKLSKDLESRQRLKDQLTGKLSSLMERLESEFGLTTIDLASKELETLRCNIKALAIDCDSKLADLKKKMREFDERASKVG